MTDYPTELRNPASIDLDQWDSVQIVRFLTEQDEQAARRVRAIESEIAHLVDLAVDCILAGGSIHYFGAGASGRLAILDATEAGPTFGAPARMLQAHFPGGVDAVLDSTIDLEDGEHAGRTDAFTVAPGDVAIGITASGSTPYVRGALGQAAEVGAVTALVTSNPRSPLLDQVGVRLIVDTGPEALTGSTRLKAGTATKIILNAFSTSVMVRTGRTYSNLMVQLTATNAKLVRRSITMLKAATGFSKDECAVALDESGGRVPVALLMLVSGKTVAECEDALARSFNVRAAIQTIIASPGA